MEKNIHIYTCIEKNNMQPHEMLDPDSDISLRKS
jgi:hypothetical protein